MSYFYCLKIKDFKLKSQNHSDLCRVDFQNSTLCFIFSKVIFCSSQTEIYLKKKKKNYNISGVEVI